MAVGARHLVAVRSRGAPAWAGAERRLECSFAAPACFLDTLAVGEWREMIRAFSIPRRLPTGKGGSPEGAAGKSKECQRWSKIEYKKGSFPRPSTTFSHHQHNNNFHNNNQAIFHSSTTLFHQLNYYLLRSLSQKHPNLQNAVLRHRRPRPRRHRLRSPPGAAGQG